jgi:hypothetical protein
MRRVAGAAARAGASSTARRQRSADKPATLGMASIFLSSETSRPPWILMGISLALPKLVADELRRQELGREVRP